MHTPTPWGLGKYPSEIVDGQDFKIVDCAELAVLSDYSNKLGIDHWAGHPHASRELTEEGADANARLIVLAVNAWGDVNALKARIAELDNLVIETLEHQVSRLRAELAKAREEEEESYKFMRAVLYHGTSCPVVLRNKAKELLLKYDPQSHEGVFRKVGGE